MKPYLSIVIPYYNAPDKLDRLLWSIRKSKNSPPYEVIIVDDGSPVPFKVQHPKIHSIRLLKNHGPAVARNRGVDAARGTFIVFLDCDVEVFPDTLAQIAKIYQDDPDIVALTGVWVKEQKSDEFFPNFKALRDWSYWIHERDASGYYFLFSTRIASIKKAVFQRLGGFDESYPAPLVEDIELTYRIARRYAIIFAPKVRVRHEFEGFWPVAKKYFWRTYFWTKLYSERKKFDPVATTVRESLTAISGVGALGAIVLGMLTFFVVPVPLIRVVFLLVGMFLMAIHIWFLRTFLLFVYREKGFAFALESLGAGLVLYTIILSGALYYKLQSLRDG